MAEPMASGLSFSLDAGLPEIVERRRGGRRRDNGRRGRCPCKGLLLIVALAGGAGLVGSAYVYLGLPFGRPGGAHSGGEMANASSSTSRSSPTSASGGAASGRPASAHSGGETARASTTTKDDENRMRTAKTSSTSGGSTTSPNGRTSSANGGSTRKALQARATPRAEPRLRGRTPTGVRGTIVKTTEFPQSGGVVDPRASGYGPTSPLGAASSDTSSSRSDSGGPAEHGSRGVSESSVHLFDSFSSDRNAGSGSRDVLTLGSSSLSSGEQESTASDQRAAPEESEADTRSETTGESRDAGDDGGTTTNVYHPSDASADVDEAHDPVVESFWNRLRARVRTAFEGAEAWSLPAEFCKWVEVALLFAGVQAWLIDVDNPDEPPRWIYPRGLSGGSIRVAHQPEPGSFAYRFIDWYRKRPYRKVMQMIFLLGVMVLCWTAAVSWKDNFVSVALKLFAH